MYKLKDVAKILLAAGATNGAFVASQCEEWVAEQKSPTEDFVLTFCARCEELGILLDAIDVDFLYFKLRKRGFSRRISKHLNRALEALKADLNADNRIAIASLEVAKKEIL